jgi:hypothetical protein
MRDIELIICHCGNAIVRCRASDGCPGWVHWGGGKHPCPGPRGPSGLITVASPRSA